ncbi:MAG: hypothetical protein GF320_16420 [Armatimonadia bacterium]|nr:hypothetical protein [Armatimonadia bacterium]
MDDRKRRLQEQVRRENQRRLVTQRITWSIIALLLTIGGIFGLIWLTEELDKPERHAKKFIATVAARDDYKVPEYQETILGGGRNEFPSFYTVEVEDKRVNETRGPEDDVEVDVLLQLQGEMVAGTTGAKARREAGEEGPTHNIFQRWQKLRNGKLHPKGEWKIVATEIVPIQ